MVTERTAAGLVFIAASVAERLGLARHGFAGFPDGHPMERVRFELMDDFQNCQ
jgi:hypothetical protein